MYLYAMPSSLVNVRLDEGHLRKVRRLRAHGIAMSDVVREAIDARFDALTKEQPTTDAAAIVARILAQHPEPSEFRPRAARDVHDRHTPQRAIRAALGRRRR